MLRISQLIQAKHPPLAYPNVCISRKPCTEIPEIVTSDEPRSLSLDLLLNANGVERTKSHIANALKQ